MWQDYRSRDGTRGNRIYGCPFAGRFGCPVKFRIEKLDGAISLQSSGKHDANSHAVEHVQRGLHHDQRAAIENIVRANPTSSATQVRRNLGLQEKPLYVSPSKHRSVMRIICSTFSPSFARCSSNIVVRSPMIATVPLARGAKSQDLRRGSCHQILLDSPKLCLT